MNITEERKRIERAAERLYYRPNGASCTYCGRTGGDLPWSCAMATAATRFGYSHGCGE